MNRSELSKEERVGDILKDWGCFTWHNKLERDWIVECVVDAVVCGNCDLGKDGVCVKESHEIKGLEGEKKMGVKIRLFGEEAEKLLENVLGWNEFKGNLSMVRGHLGQVEVDAHLVIHVKGGVEGIELELMEYC